MKYGKVKKEHSRVAGLDKLLARVLAEGPGITRIVPGRISRRRGNSAPRLKIQYPTTTGLKCLYEATGSVQEVFIVSRDEAALVAWLIETKIVGSK